ncbi:MAG TPA: hypothetical protein VN934_11730 [Candidatus Tumulicola sp.]|nr:hypothetical protein [Candidatus Tumulicola sp.]
MEILSAVASVGTFVVILVTAFAALIQLRHMRSGNQIAALTECREIIESRDFFAARRFVQDDLPLLLQDPAVVARLERRVLDDQLQPINYIGNFFENLGAFVKYGIIDRGIALDLWSGVVLTAWTALLPVTRIRRKVMKTQALLENFEYLAVLCDDYIARHPDGTYPSGMRRMPDS